jgi:hypothetical protein
VLSKVSVVVGVGGGPKDSAPYWLMAGESTMDKMSAEEKNFKGFPMFFTIENF